MCPIEIFEDDQQLFETTIRDGKFRFRLLAPERHAELKQQAVIVEGKRGGDEGEPIYSETEYQRLAVLDAYYDWSGINSRKVPVAFTTELLERLLRQSPVMTERLFFPLMQPWNRAIGVLPIEGTAQPQAVAGDEGK